MIIAGRAAGTEGGGLPPCRGSRGRQEPSSRGRLPMSNANGSCPLSHLQCLMSNVQCQAQNVQRPMSSRAGFRITLNDKKLGVFSTPEVFGPKILLFVTKKRKSAKLEWCVEGHWSAKWR